MTTQAVAAGRKLRDPEARARRKAERAAGRADLRQRFAQYRNFVSAGDTEYFQKLKALREHRSRDRKEIRDVAKAARRAISPTIDREVRLISLVAIDVEATRRRLAVDAKWQERQNALRATRVPPLPWREWLYEQANRGDKAALSALRGIVYQAQRDAKLPQRGEDDLDDLEASAADYRELQHKRLMARLLIEERKEAAIRASSVYAMRPHEVDSLILSYAGLQWRVTGNGNVEYSRNDGQHLFTDRGNRLTFDRMRVTDNEIQLALVHACEKFGRQLTLTGDDPIFVTRMVCLADDMGLAILNPDLQPAVVAHRAAKKLQAGRAAEEAARRDLLASSGASRPRDSDERAKAGPTAATPVPQGSKPDEVSTDVLEAMLNQLQPSKPTIPAPGQDRLRALVLAIDPRAKFEEVHASNEARLYVGPIAAVLDGDEPMFAQHLGRGIYAIHRQLFTEPHDGQSAEIRYRAGAIQVGVSRHGPDREV